MEMTKRVFKGISGMILALVAGVGTTNVNAQCSVDIIVNQNPGNCSTTVILEANVSDPVQSWTYYINGEIVSSDGFVMLDLTPGTYIAEVVVITDQGCTAVDDSTFTVAGNPLEVDAGSDVVSCQAQTTLSASVNSTNPYSIYWYPEQFLDNSESANPTVIQNVDDQWFIVDVVDDVTGCVNSDTIQVSQYGPIVEEFSLCDGPVEIDMGPGADEYEWVTYTDTAGNASAMNYPTIQQSITVNEPGSYLIIAHFPDCGAITSQVVVEACEDCFNAFATQETVDQCSETIEFLGTGTGTIVSYEWDFGDGATATGNFPTHTYTAGTYDVQLTTVDMDGCVATSQQTIQINSGHTVVTSSDTIGCQEDAYMEAFVTGGSGDYSYEWFPQTGLSDPYSAVTHASGVHEQSYIVEVTDNVSGCVYGDEITVSSYVAQSETLYLCDDSVLVDLGPGANFYNLAPLSLDQQQQSVWTDDTGSYVFYADFPNCGAITSTFDIEECPSTCSSTITSTLNYGNCGAWVNLIASYSSPIDSAVWNLGNGDVVVDYGNGIPAQFYEGGNYIVQLTAYHTGGCISTNGYGITLLTDVTVDINAEDTIACAGQLFLDASATGGGGQYTYYWPQTGSTTPNIVLGPTQNQWVTVEVFDSFTGCSDSDSIYVYANQQINETIELCQSSVPLIVDPGSMGYNWTYTDQAGNTTNLSNQTNQLDASNLGTYTCFTYYSGCLQVDHMFEVIACGTNCSSEFISAENTINCGLWVDFAGTAFSSPVDSVVWDFGDGDSYTDQGGGIFHEYGTGTFTATMTTYHTDGCISTSSELFNFSNPLEVQLIEDTVACSGTLFLNQNTTGGSGDYSYNWVPASTMDDPTAANPQMTVQNDVWVEVFVTDDQTGCTASDYMFVYENEAVFDTLQLCVDSVQLELNAGSTVYSWSYTDQFGNVTQIQNFINELWVDEPGVYSCVTYYSGCNDVTHTFIVEECASQNGEVWPGDANSDNIVTNTDALYLGLAFNQTGPVRPAATLNWVGQPCPDWNFNFAQNNVNLKHADCDGNGIVNFDDTLAIDFNYSNTHNKFEGESTGGNPPLWIEATPDTTGLDQVVDIIVHLGTMEQPVDSLHGLSFSLTFNQDLVQENGLTVDFENCVLGTAGIDVLTFQKNQFINGALDLAVTRNTLENFEGYGPIVHARIVTTDNLSGMHDLPIGISSVTAITATEAPVEFAWLPDTVVIDPERVGVSETAMSNLVVYPNPAAQQAFVNGLKGKGTITMVNTLGQVVMFIPYSGSDRLVLPVNQLNSGIYYLTISSNAETLVKKLKVVH